MKNLRTKLSYALYALLCAVYLMGCRQGWNVKAGQIWVKEYNIDNPYEPIKRDTIVIIDVIGDYAQYKRNGKLMSDNKYWIPVNGRLLK